LITGSEGFIGSNLCKEKHDDNLIAVDVDTRKTIFEPCFPWHKITKIYHMGAVSSTVETDVRKIYELNIEYSLRLFESAIKHKIPVVYASSASVYGNSADYSINPLNYYALSKATVDQWIADNIQRFTNITSYRFFNVYGNGEQKKASQASPIHKFSEEAKRIGKIQVFEGSEHFYRDFIWVGDIVKYIQQERDSGIYDLGTSRPISFMDIAKLVATKYNTTIELIPFPAHLNGKYQWNTCSQRHIEGNFTTVEKYLQLDKIIVTPSVL
jgi:ADP-L-glycero-D-manno-heptose 6-epimerase